MNSIFNQAIVTTGRPGDIRVSDRTDEHTRTVHDVIDLYFKYNDRNGMLAVRDRGSKETLVWAYGARMANLDPTGVTFIGHLTEVVVPGLTGRRGATAVPVIVRLTRGDGAPVGE